ncbi:magnesium-transporting ATPase, P-type 1 [Parachlamydia acanthamoebae UV-7]|uniref:Magnesium-transporting ATPase, P-type 1 n=2 Tax=Parachlamydia acanthamoebae TaxID=83552 RepID=F8KZY6_PARAV|nr:magnesium-translocating P-type ATPase [Parachlamydia acanthamoebae]KIA77793.1 Magnesium-transporting ATPase, P-type 1 [Parachlamydia acanthamoebae]CCB86495.1 magnesium-transporting ATPase, P-type 1 [Parachlamydia acanthamoebae UV-7]
MKLQEMIHSLKSLFFTTHNTVQETDKKISSILLAYSKVSLEDIYKELESSITGLVQKEAEERLLKYGANEIVHERPPTWYSLMLGNFKNPFVVLMIFLGVVSFFLKQYDSVVIITFMVIISVLMRFIQEYRSNKAAEKLKALVSTKATVLRRPSPDSETKSYEINMKSIVPGDIIHLSAGDMVPADLRLIAAKELYISQSSLTGESFPVEKDGALKPKEDAANPLEMPNLCFMGTNVLNGSGTAIVLKTNQNTYLGTLSANITGKAPLTSFDLGINKVTWLLIKFIFFMVPCVFLLNGLTKGEWLEALLFSLAIAIGLTPEMLPMIVTANLARGAVQMSRSKVVVKRLNSIQNFGAMDILCTDKTGTLTQDHIILEQHLDAEGNENEEVLFYGYLNSFYQTGLKNLLDVAVLQHTEIEKKINLNKDFRKVDEIPFDFARRRMSVVVQKDPETQLLVCKGAVEETLAICNTVRMNGSKVPITAEVKEKIDSIKNDLSGDGLRVLGVSYGEFPVVINKEYKVGDEQDLVFMGFLAFLDPPKLSAQKAIAYLNTYGVNVKILTGDNELVTQKICKWVNLMNEGTLLGSQIDKLSEEELKIAVEKTTVFAKLTPLQKSRVVSTLKSNGHTVGFLGDGINDAPALREADIGISVDTAVDIAKESADIIMLEKNLMFLADGVIEGRKTFGNIIKYIKMALSSNFGNVFSVLGASALLPFLPMLSVQILLQNLLYDFSQTTIPFDCVDEEFLIKPRKWDPQGIAKFMVFIGPISSIFDYVTFAVMWFVFAANTVENQAIFQTGWFIEGLLSQTLIVHMIRTQKIPFIQSLASFPLLLSTVVIMAIGILIPYSFIGTSIGLTALPGSYFYWLAAILLAYCILTQLVKNWFIKRFHYWL